MQGSSVNIPDEDDDVDVLPAVAKESPLKATLPDSSGTMGKAPATASATGGGPAEQEEEGN